MGDSVRGVVTVWWAVLGWRLVIEKTTATATACSPSVSHQHGPAPYEHSYGYNAINNLTAGPAGTYSSPTPGLGVERPHAPTSIGGVGDGWNAAGQLTSRMTTAMGLSP